MKNTFLKLTYILGLIHISLQIIGQNLETNFLKATGIFYNTNKEARIRWAPQDFKTLQLGLQFGYKIVRIPISKGYGQDYFSPENQEQLKITINIPPVDFENTSGLGSDQELFTVFKKIVQGDLDPSVNSTEPKLSDAIKAKRTDESKHLFGILLADRSFQLAQAVGLGYTDNQFLEGYEYDYIISLNQPLNGKIVQTICKVTDIPWVPLPKPSEIKGEGVPGKATIGWKMEGLKKHYTYYNIFRSTDEGESFKLVNQTPFLHMVSVDAKSDGFAYYTDSLPKTAANYVYKVAGISPFGFNGEFSDTVQINLLPPPLGVEIEIDSFYTTAAGSMKLRWKVNPVDLDYTPQALLTDVAGYLVQKRANMDTNPSIVSSSLIPADTKSFDLGVVTEDYLYNIVLLDIYGRRYESLTYLGQFVDSIPPAAPQQLTATVDSDGKIVLEWQKNSEKDFKGYKVFSCYNKENAPLQVNSTPIDTNIFVTYIGIEEAASDTIYYQVKAIDFRENVSQPSNFAQVTLPDLLPPSSPALSRILPRPEGLRISWELSPDKDVKQHILQRKVPAATEWTNVTTISSLSSFPKMAKLPEEFMASNFVDSSELELREYEYRLIAQDNAGNKSYSEIVTAKPFDDGTRGKADSLKARVFPLGWVLNLYANPQGGIIQDSTTSIPSGLESYLTYSDGYLAKLHWTYKTRFPSSLIEFKIYQKREDGTATNPNYTLIKTIPAATAKEMAKYNGVSVYAAFIDLDKSTFSTPKEFKIIGMHSDGGYSLPAKAILEGN